MSAPPAKYLAFLSCTLAIVGWIISLVGLCASAAWVRAVSWWIIVYELGLVVLVCSVVWADTQRAYQSLILALIAVSIPYATDEIVSYIDTARPPLAAAAAGYIVLVVTKFCWLFLFGVHYDENSRPSFLQQMNQTGVHKAGHPPTMSSTPLPVYMPSPPPSHDAPPTVFISPHTEYTIPVIALHTYEANPDDPNELSFNKGETMHIHERKGSWWQARKSNGTVGLIPSNYASRRRGL
ncbi:hypothetical protein BCR43DRAFT_517459 [Syncephalastrum racemosum]|uniref:SH3 domain-containing protein n=1 Tax=Syncephalastrum racemosum TaxID=13706 RepID=A0A1X2H4E5_SYNRA|nr:hypothetical protein BCR43DRAFT_517459 [Syncephalastrum racemosum]